MLLYIIVSLVQRRVLKPFIIYTDKALHEKRELTPTEIEACMKSYKNFDIGVAVTETIGFVLGSGYSVISESMAAPEPFSIILIIQIIMQSVGFGFLNFVIIVFCVKRIEMTKILRKVGVRNIKNSLSSILSATVVCIIYMCIMNMTLVSEGLILNPRPAPMQTYGLYATIGAALTVLGCWIMYRLLIKRMQNNEAEVSRVLHEETENLAVATKQSASTSQDQNAAVKEIVATMQGNSELNDNIDKKVRNVSEHAEKSRNDVIAGVIALDENAQGLLEIMECNKSTIEGIKNLGVKIERVWDIVSLINDIADTAKIIAFNAELEASSAGESGKNFHIVATEVRRL